MATQEQIKRKTSANGVDLRCWGHAGSSAAEAIEHLFGFSLPQQVKEFATTCGNAMIGPFSVVVCGDEAGEFNCQTETISLRERQHLSLHPAAALMVKIMDDAEESYFCMVDSGQIVCYETRRVRLGEEIHTFESFDAFIDWLIEQARQDAESDDFHE